MSYPIDLNDLVYRAHTTARDKGFWQGFSTTLPHGMAVVLTQSRGAEDILVEKVLAKLALLTSEIGEAVEAVRQDGMGNLEEELADICIRVFDLAGALNFNLQQAILTKMTKNEARPHMHGKLA